MRKLVLSFLVLSAGFCAYSGNANAQPPSDDLVVWLAADVGVTTDDNGVTNWEDLSGNGNDAFRQEAYGPGWPELSCGTFPSGDHIVLNFNGDTGMDFTFPEELRPVPEISIYIVAESTGGRGGNLLTNYSNEINWGSGYIVRWIGLNQPSFFTSDRTSATISDDNSGFQATDGYHVLTATISNTSGEKRMYLDGGQVTQETTIFDLTGKQYGFFESGSERISIGSFREFDVSLNTRRWHRGGIAEILVYSTVDASQRSEVEEYLNDKYFDPAATPPPLPDLPPTGLQCQAKLDGSEVTLNWKPCGVYNSQQILRDGEEIASVAGDASTFVDEDPTIGTVTYVIEASPSGGGELLSGECVVDVVLPFFEGRILHLAADQGVVSGPNGVESWIDQAPIGGQQDAFKDDGFGLGPIVESCGDFPNGTHPVLQFPGTNELETGAGLGILNPEGLRRRNLSIYAVVESSIGAGSIIGVYSNSVNWGWGFNLRMQPGGVGSFPCFFTTAGTSQTIHDVCSVFDAPTGYRIVTATISSILEEKKVYVDGVLLDDSNYVLDCTTLDPPCSADFNGRSMDFDGSERPAIGSFREFQDGDGSRRYHTGGIAEIIIYDSVDEDQREMVEAELRAKYFEGNSAANLPPSGLVCTRSPDGTEVQLNWANCGTYEALRLFRNGQLIFELGETATSFLDNFSVPLGDVTYLVEAEFDDGTMTGPSCTVRDPRTAGCPPFATDPQLVLWLDANEGVTTDANGVTTWTDKTGGNDAITRVAGVDDIPFGTGWPQETTATFPAGEFPVLDFDGDTGMEVDNPGDFALTEVSMFVVAEIGPASGQLITNYSNSVNWGWGWNFHALGRDVFGGGDPTAVNLFTSSGTCGTISDFPDTGLLAPAADSYAVISATISNTAGAKAIYIDGVLGSTRPMGNPNFAACPPESGTDFAPTIAYDGTERVGIGSFREFDGGTRAHIGGIAEVLIFASADDDLREDVESYLMKKYFTGDSPVDCPDAPDPTGACCTGANCDVQTEADCTAGGGTYQGNGVACGSIECDTTPRFRRGDHDGSGLADITDALNLLGFLFLGTTPPICGNASDFDNSGALDITDALILLGHLFLGQPSSLPAPGTSCGPNPTTPQPGIPPIPPQEVTDLGCETYPGPAFPEVTCP